MSVTWSADGRADLNRIYEFNLGFGDTRADQVDARLISVGEWLATKPRIERPTRRAGVCEWSVPDIQYVIRYLLDDDRITILQVRHTREHRETP